MSELIYKDESYAIMGACFEAYKEKSCGYSEPVYHECIGIEMSLRGIPAISKPKLQLEYKGQKLEATFEPDYVCYNKIVLELKAVAKLIEGHRAQVLNYLKSSNMRLGLLVNFSHYPNLEWERIVANDKWEIPAPINPDLHA